MCHGIEAGGHTIMYSSQHRGDDCIMAKFIITPKEDKTVTMTIRIDKELQEEYSDLAAKTNRSRNELISMALRYALDNMELQDE